MPFTDIFMTQEGGSRGALGARHPKSQWVGRPCPFRGPGWAGAQDQLPGPLPASHPAEFLKGLSLRPGRACWALEDSPQGAPAPRAGAACDLRAGSLLLGATAPHSLSSRRWGRVAVRSAGKAPLAICVTVEEPAFARRARRGLEEPPVPSRGRVEGPMRRPPACPARSSPSLASEKERRVGARLCPTRQTLVPTARTSPRGTKQTSQTRASRGRPVLHSGLTASSRSPPPPLSLF